MKWIKIERKYGTPAKKTSVRAGFYKRKKNGKQNFLHLLISNDLIEKLGIDLEKRVDFYLSEDNKKIWLLKQEKKSVWPLKQEKNSEGHKFVKKTKSCSSISITWDYFELPTNKTKLKELKYDFYDDGLRIYYED